MYRPYIVCHMVTSIDGKVTGEFLNRPECEAATEIYYEMNREYKAQGSGGFICGRVTMKVASRVVGILICQSISQSKNASDTI